MTKPLTPLPGQLLRSEVIGVRYFARNGENWVRTLDPEQRPYTLESARKAVETTMELISAGRSKLREAEVVTAHMTPWRAVLEGPTDLQPGDPVWHSDMRASGTVKKIHAHQGSATRVTVDFHGWRSSVVYLSKLSRVTVGEQSRPMLADEEEIDPDDEA